MKNKAFLAALAIPAAMMATTAFAADSNTATTVTHPTKHEVKQCVRTAAKTDIAAIKAANTAYRIALKTARTTRHQAILDAEKITDSAQREAAIKAANEAYKASAKTARQDWHTARTAAQSAFKTAKEACKK